MIKLSKTFQYKAIKTWFKIGGALTPRLTARIAYQAFFTRPLRQIPLLSDIKLLDMATVLKRHLEITPTQFDLQYLYPEGINYSGLIIHDLNDSVIPYTEALKLANIWPQAGLITTIGLEHSGVLKDEQLIK